jgi:hypothetical protein
MEKAKRMLRAMHADIEAMRYENQEHCFELTGLGGGVKYFVEWPNLSILSRAAGELLKEIDGRKRAARQPRN